MPETRALLPTMPTKDPPHTPDEQVMLLRRLLAGSTQADKHDRHRLALTLHDGLQQLLIVARMKVGKLRRQLRDHDSSATVAQLDELLNESINESRCLAAELSPPLLYEQGLGAAVEWLAAQLEEKQGFQAEIVSCGAVEVADEDARVLLYLAVRELALNAARHARVDRARLEIDGTRPQELRVCVCDKGAGFDAAKLGLPHDGEARLGLCQVREWIQSLGGQMEIESLPGRGTRVSLVVPVLTRGPATSASGPAVRLLSEENGTETEQGPSGVRTAASLIRVLIADDHPILRKGLTDALEEHEDIELVGEAADGEQAVALSLQHRPDVVLMDVTMPRLDGLGATRRIMAEMPGVRIIGLSMHEEDDMAASMRKAGAVAYLSKGGSAEKLLEAIRRAAGR